MPKPYRPQKLPLKDIDWVAHIPAIAKANAALARYDALIQTMVNPTILLSPMTTQEAVLSSRIEGTQATLEEVLEFEAEPADKVETRKHEDIQEIINYRRAMQAAVTLLEKRPLCLNVIRELHSILLDSVRGANKARGKFRRVQNWIGPPDCPIEQATFVPPSPEMLPEALDNWERYLHFDEKDRLVQLAVAKAQFELIHPFLDGNGRIGRMLVPLFLFEKKLISSPVFYISAYFERRREDYYRALRAISQSDDWNGWIRFFLDAVIEQAFANVRKAEDALKLYEKMKQDIPAATRSQYAIQAIDALFVKPIFRSADFIDTSGIPRDSAFRILKQLEKRGIIKTLRQAKGRKAAVWMFTELIRIAEDLK